MYFFYSVVRSNWYEGYFNQPIIITIMEQTHNYFDWTFNFYSFIGYYTSFEFIAYFEHWH